MVASLMPARSSLAMSSAQVDSSHCSGFQSPPKTKRPPGAVMVGVGDAGDAGDAGWVCAMVSVMMRTPLR